MTGKWKHESDEGVDIPATAVVALCMCDVDIFPSIKTLFTNTGDPSCQHRQCRKILVYTPPIKDMAAITDERNTRLTSLTLLHTHRDIRVNCEKVIDHFVNGNCG
ncbi:hypothetical protein MRX96_010617 [Rhipicephalus microplus]